MTIQDAIAFLQAMRDKGTQNIIIAVWDAQAFDLEEDEFWGELAERAEQVMDWSATHDRLFDIIEEEKDNG